MSEEVVSVEENLKKPEEKNEEKIEEKTEVVSVEEEKKPEIESCITVINCSSFVKKIPVTCYLIKGNNGKYLMVDTGSKGKDFDIIWKIIEPLEIEYIVITHCHQDHVGNVKKIKEKKGSKIIVHEFENKYLMEGGMTPSKPRVFVFQVLFGILSVFGGRKVKDLAVSGDIIIKDGEDNEIYEILKKDYNVEIIFTPGHTLGSISVYQSTEECVFIGDIVGNYFTVDDWGWHFLYLSKKMVLESLKKITSKNPKKIYAPHVSKVISNEEMKKKFNI